MSGSKVKGILKYITHIFDSDKEQDIQIGYPTDVKHVAHIGWDGPSVNSPSWMNEFKSSPSPGMPGDLQNRGHDHAAKRHSEDTKRRTTRDLPELPPKASKRQLMDGVTESPIREKTNKPRQPRKSNKPKDESNPSRMSVPVDPFPPSTVPDIPKKSRRHKSKENSSGSAKLRSKAHSSPDSGSPTQSKTRNKSSFEENEEGIIV